MPGRQAWWSCRRQAQVRWDFRHLRLVRAGYEATIYHIGRTRDRAGHMRAIGLGERKRVSEKRWATQDDGARYALGSKSERMG